MSMSDHRTAEIIAAHMALSSPAALAWRRVVHGEITAEEAVALLEGDEERELARRVFAAPTQERREALLAALLTALSAAGSEGRGCEVPEPVGRAVRASPSLPGSMSIRSHAASSGETPAYVLDGRLRLVLRPETAVTHAVQVLAFGREPSGRVVRLAFEPVVDSSSGVVILEGTVRDTGLTTGDWELVIVIGHPEALPFSWDVLNSADAPEGVVGYEVVRQRLNVVTTLTMH